MPDSIISAAYYTGDKKFSVEQIEAQEPCAGEVQIDVAYCGICGTDLHVYLGHMDARVGNRRVIGHEMSGTISKVGEGVNQFEIGQRIVVRPLEHCGDCPACERGLQHICQNLKFIGIDCDGAFQEKWCVPAHTVHLLPDELSLAHAALVEPLAVASHDCKRAQVKPGEDVLVIGGGPIGMLVAMVARAKGANVSISEINENRLRFASEQGFEIYYPAQGNVAEAYAEATGGKGADVVFEVSGSQAGVDLMTQVAACRARICMVAIHATKPTIDLFQFFWREIEMIGARVYEPEDYENALGLLADGKLDAEVMITGVKPLSDIESAFLELTTDANAMKTLIQLSEE